MSAITTITRPDGVAVLTFDQPGSKANVLSRELWIEFGDALTALAKQTDIRGLVLVSAKPGIFIAGADLKLLANAPTPNDPDVGDFIDLGLRVLEQLASFPVPTCAAIDGAALGGGLEVTLTCDYRLCGTHPKVQLGLPEVKLGLIPGWGGTQRLPRILRVLPLAKSCEMLTTGEPLNAQQAEAIGLVDAVVDSELLLDRTLSHLQRGSWVERRMRKVSEVPKAQRADFVAVTAMTAAEHAAIRVLTAGAALQLEEAMKVETAAFLKLAGSDESKRLIAEFFASRKK